MHPWRFRQISVVDTHRILKYGSSLALLLWITVAHPAVDATDTFQPFVSDSVIYDSNVFRLSGKLDPHAVLPHGASKSDVMNQLSAGGTINYTLSRQRFVLDLRVDDNRFAHNQSLNNTSTNDRAAWYWNLGRQLSGDAGYAYRRSLAPFAYNQTFRKDIISEHEAFLDADYAFHPRWKITTGARWLESAHSNQARTVLNRQSATGLVGLNYLTPSNNSVGMEYKFSEVDLPNRQLSQATLIDNHYQVQAVSAKLAWALKEKLQLDGQFGYTSLQNRHFSQRDFSGETWRLALGWTPTAKTQLNLAGWRELYPSQLVNASYVVAEGVSLSPVWSATAKLTFETKISYETRDYTGLSLGNGERHDKLLRGQAVMIYTPLRNVEINLAYRADQRHSTQLFADYMDNSVFASARFQF